MYSNIQIGDEVAISTGITGRKIAKVTNVTPKRFIAGRITFSKDKGRAIGDFGWNRPSIISHNKDKIEEIRLDIIRKNLAVKLKEFDYLKLNIEQINQIKSIIDGVK